MVCVRVRVRVFRVFSLCCSQSEMADDTPMKSDAVAEEMPMFVSPIAAPLANKKLTKKCLKLVKKGASGVYRCCLCGRVVLGGVGLRSLTLCDCGCVNMSCAAAKVKAIRRGVKEVVKALRKNEKGYVWFVEAATLGWRIGDCDPPPPSHYICNCELWRRVNFAGQCTEYASLPVTFRPSM
jgi:hypothetical protein